MRYCTNFVSLGHEVNKEDVDEVYNRFLELADREKQVPDESLKTLIEDFEQVEKSCVNTRAVKSH